MNNINIPSISASYIELNVYNIRFSAEGADSTLSVVAPDTLFAIQAFAYLHPSKDILNIVCCGPCVALYPTFPPKE